jgi:hypothetical protein
MKTIKKVAISVIYVDTIPDDKDMSEATLYVSEKYGSASHLCLCGCGNGTYTGLKHDIFPNQWELVKEPDGTVSIIGSIWNKCFPCNSHYIITKNVANFC